MNSKKVIVCDLDGTLAESKSKLSHEMAEVLRSVLSKHFLAVVSGGSLTQFQSQFLSVLDASDDLLKHLVIFPTMGATCYKYENGWQKLYEEKLSDNERQEIKDAFMKVISDLKVDLGERFGDILEDRGTQVTFSGKGQEAPVEVKEKWDPNQEKRQEIVQKLRKVIPQFEVRIGGATSIDVTRKGIDKAYAIGKLKEILGVNDDEIVFVGDALYKGGNDSAVKNTAVDYIQESGPAQTIEFLRQYA